MKNAPFVHLGGKRGRAEKEKGLSSTPKGRKGPKNTRFCKNNAYKISLFLVQTRLWSKNFQET
jgi:hypothetical protein